MKFNYSTDSQGANIDPEYMRQYGEDLPPIQAKGNLSYLQFIDVLTKTWKILHPEIDFVPLGGKKTFDPEKGYIIYSLESRRPSDNNSKPRMHRVIDDPDNNEKKVIVYTQSFNNLIKFIAVHQSPRVSEELLDAFEDFMLYMEPILKKLGLQHCFYDRRMPDEHGSRYGEDVSARIVSYLVITQKILTVDIDVIEDIILKLTINESATPNTFLL